MDDTTVGGGPTHALRLDTVSSDLVMMQSRYQPSNDGKHRNSTGQTSLLLPRIDPCHKADSQYSLYTDLINIHGMTANSQAIFDLNWANVSSDFSFDGYDRFLGLSANGAGTPTGQKSLLRSLCQQNSLEECRFGVALNSDMDGKIFQDQVGSGALFLGGLNQEYFDGPFQTIPLQTSTPPANASRRGMQSVGQWMAKGEFLIGESDNVQAPLQGQSIFFNVDSELVRKPCVLPYQMADRIANIDSDRRTIKPGATTF